MKEFNKTDNTGLFMEEKKKQEAEKIAAEKARVMKVPGLLSRIISPVNLQNKNN